MNHLSLKMAVLTEDTVIPYVQQLEQRNIPFEPLVDSIIRQNNWMPYEQLIKYVIEQLVNLLNSHLDKPATTFGGKILRIGWKILSFIGIKQNK